MPAPPVFLPNAMDEGVFVTFQCTTIIPPFLIIPPVGLLFEGNHKCHLLVRDFEPGIRVNVHKYHEANYI